MRKRAILWLGRAAAVLAAVLAAIWVTVARPGLPVRGSYRPDRKIPATSLEKHVRVLAEELVPRDHSHPDNLDAVARYISAVFREAGLAPRDQAFGLGGREYRNVVVELGPPSGKVLVLGAHYDAAGERPGADDNASGVACLLEIGRLLAVTGLRSRVILVAYTLEEPPHFGGEHMGSAFHAQSLLEEDVDVELMISLEMLGYYSDRAGSQEYPTPLLHLFYPSTGDFIAVVDRLRSGRARRIRDRMRRVIDVPVYSLNAPSFVRGVDFSDHRSYWARGFDAVMITDTAFYRNQAYHTGNDTPDRLDYARMAQVAYGVYSFVRERAGGS